MSEDTFSTEIIAIMDRSGSMRGIAATVSQEFVGLIEDQRKIPGNCTITLVQFDDKYELLCEAVPLDQMPPFSLVPRGGTALLDAIGRTLSVAKARIVDMHNAPEKVICVIITDGKEQDSKEFSRKDIIELINELTGKGWEFIYMGANQDGIRAASSLGIASRGAATFEASSKGVGATRMAVSAYIGETRDRAARSRGPATMNLQAQYTTAEAKLGDKKPRLIAPEQFQEQLKSKGPKKGQ